MRDDEMPGMRFVFDDARAVRDRHTMHPEDAVQWWMRHRAGRERSDDGEIVDSTMERLGLGLDTLVIDEQLRGSGDGMRHDPLENDIVDLEDLVDTSKPSLTFIEIALRDDDGYPIGDETFEVDLPDGRVWSGKLDAAGCARVDGIPRGHCVVRFPQLVAA